MSWITNKLLGLRAVIFGGEQLPERGALEFTGDGVEVEDDAINKRTLVTIAGGGSIADVTAGSNIAVTTPEDGVRQVALSATPSVTSVTVSSHVQVGANAARRIQDAAATSAGHHRIGSDGRWRGFFGSGVNVESTYLLAMDQIPEAAFSKGPDANALDEVDERPIFGPVSGEHIMFPLGSLQLVTTDNVTADDTNYASFTITVYNASGAVGSSRTITTKATGSGATGNITARVPKTVSVSLGVIIPDGGSVYFKLEKEGTGVQLPGLRFLAKFVRTDFATLI